jgi:hypothetical protein
VSSRRASLPGAAELFRSTRSAPEVPGPGEPAAPEVKKSAHSRGTQRKGTGRERHNTKITVYVSDEELLELEHARLGLRAAHGLVVDRGRIVREAVAVLLEDLEAHGDESLLVRRLRVENDE